MTGKNRLKEKTQQVERDSEPGRLRAWRRELLARRWLAQGRNGSIEHLLHEPSADLDVAVKRMEQEVEQRQKAEARYRTLFDQSPIALWEEDYSEVKATIDQMQLNGVRNFRVYFEDHIEEALAVLSLAKTIEVNRAALKLRGFKDIKELVDFKKKIVRLNPQGVVERLEAIAEGLTEFESEGFSLTQKGETRYTMWHYSVIQGHEQTYGRVIVSILDITASRKVENTLRQEARRLELLNAITSASLALGDSKTTLRTLAERMCDFGRAEDCFITLWDSEKQIPLMIAATGNVEERLMGQFIGPGEPSITRTVMEIGRVLIAEPYESMFLNQRIAPFFGNGTALALPLQVGEKKIGAAVLVFSKTPHLTDEDLDLWNQVAAQVSLAIASMQLFDQWQQHTNELEKLVRVSLDLRQAQTYGQILDLLIREMAKTVGADRCALIIKRGKKWMLATEQSYQLDAKMEPCDLSDEMIKGMLESAQKYQDNFPPAGGYQGKCPWLQGLGSFMFVPLHTSNLDVGLAAVGWQAGREVNLENRRMLTTIAAIAGNALQRACLLETLEQRVMDRTRDLQILYDLSALSNRQRGIRNVMQSALKQMITVVGGTGGLFYLAKSGKAEMEISISKDIPAGLKKHIVRLAIDAERMRQLENARGPIFVPDIHVFHEVPDAVLSKGLNAAFGMPVWVGRKFWGLMVILGDAATMNLEEESLFIAMADLVGTAAENADLQKSARDMAVMEERQRLARALHDSVTQSLYSLTLFSEAGREHARDGNPERALHYLERSSETAQRALREMRMLLYELRPPELEKLGLAGALRYRLETVERRVGLEAQFTVRQTTPVSAEHEEALFWIALEALNNTLKHANASKVSLNLRLEKRRVVLEIVDNGLGFEPKNLAGGGMGMLGMSERAEKIGAQLMVDSAPYKGTRVKVVLKPDLAKKEKIEHE